MKNYSLFCMALFILGCTPHRNSSSSLRDEYSSMLSSEQQTYMANQHEKELMENICSVDSLVGEETGINLITSYQKSLEGFKAEIGVKQYSKLSQELAGYSVEWEILHKDIVRSCKQYAVCVARDSTKGICNNAKSEYDSSIEASRSFLLKMKGIKIVN